MIATGQLALGIVERRSVTREEWAEHAEKLRSQIAETDTRLAAQGISKAEREAQTAALRALLKRVEGHLS